MRGNAATQPWSDDEKAIVTRMWGANASARDSLSLNNRSRNAVIGLIARLKLQRGPTGKRIKPTKPRPPVERKHNPALQWIDHPKRRRSAEPAVEIDDAPGAGVSLMQLTNSTCRWPIGAPGEDGFKFCGANADLNGGRPFCAWHTRIAYEPPAARVKRK